ncbi:hypothetical protein ACFYYY_16320 [Streptomyces sp. NPDC001834]
MKIQSIFDHRDRDRDHGGRDRYGDHDHGRNNGRHDGRHHGRGGRY